MSAHGPAEDAGPGAGAATSVPDAELLEHLGSDAWALIQRHARAALHALPDAELTPRLIQLRALPAARLVAGRARHDLAAALAAGGELWSRTATALGGDPAAAEIVAILEGQRPAPDPPAPRPPPRPEAGRDPGDRAKLKRVRAERDEARRRATGAEARAATAEARIEALSAALSDAEERIVELEAAVAGADDHRRDVLDRERRRHEVALAAVTDELREHRRIAEERRRIAARSKPREPEADPPPSAHTAAAVPRDPEALDPRTAEYAAAVLRRGRAVVVDGYNVAQQARPGISSADQRAWLTRLLQAAGARLGVEFTLVWDAKQGTVVPNTRQPRGIRVRYATDVATADDEIVLEVEAADDVLVVTDDVELRGRVQAVGGAVVGTVPFLSVVQ